MRALEEKVIINGIEYNLVGDYYVPNIALSDEELGFGFYGRKHLCFLREHKPEKYEELIRTNTLHRYINELDRAVHRRKQELLCKLLEDVATTAKSLNDCSLSEIQRIHSIYTEVETVIRAEYVYV